MQDPSIVDVYGPDGPPRRRVCPPATFGLSRTQQAHAKESDINTIMARYKVTRMLPQAQRQASFGDFTTGDSYHELLTRVRNLEQHFADQPAAIRKACKNDPGNYLELCLNPELEDEAIRLGLKTPPPSKA